MTMPNSTCRVCKQSYNAEKNNDESCQFHPLYFRGAEAGWYLDIFTKEVNYSGVSKLSLMQKWQQTDLCKKMESISIQPCTDVDMESPAGDEGMKGGMYDIEATKLALATGHGTVYFWECCGSYDFNAPGCRRAKHRSYDDP